jgi:hypothetical protein
MAELRFTFERLCHKGRITGTICGVVLSAKLVRLLRQGFIARIVFGGVSLPPNP